MQTVLAFNDPATSAAMTVAAKSAGLLRPDAFPVDGEWAVIAGRNRTMYKVVETEGGYGFAR